MIALSTMVSLAEPGTAMPRSRTEGVAVFNSNVTAYAFRDALFSEYPPAGYGTECSIQYRDDGKTAAHWRVWSAD